MCGWVRVQAGFVCKWVGMRVSSCATGSCADRACRRCSGYAEVGPQWTELPGSRGGPAGARGCRRSGPAVAPSLPLRGELLRSGSSCHSGTCCHVGHCCHSALPALRALPSLPKLRPFRTFHPGEHSTSGRPGHLGGGSAPAQPDLGGPTRAGPGPPALAREHRDRNPSLGGTRPHLSGAVRAAHARGDRCSATGGRWRSDRGAVLAVALADPAGPRQHLQRCGDVINPSARIRGPAGTPAQPSCVDGVSLR